MKSVYKCINHLANSQRRLIEKMTINKDYSGAQAKVLHFLFCSQGKLIHQKDIENEFGFRASTATEILRAMEANGLIHRIPGKNDARCREISLTEQAMQYRDDVLADMEALQTLLTKDISEDALNSWIRISLKMLENIGGSNA